MSSVTAGAVVPVWHFKRLCKEAGAAAGAAAIQEKSTWLVSGETVILNFHKKINTQDGSCHCRLQKTGIEKLALELDGFHGEWVSHLLP
jgi:hypothetical protein